MANRELFEEDEMNYYVEMGNSMQLVNCILKCLDNED